jgi:hypothetical protein
VFCVVVVVMDGVGVGVGRWCIWDEKSMNV